MVHSTLPRIAALVDDYLLIWVLLSVGIGFALPSIAVLTPLSTLILAVMIGSVSLTLAPDRFRELRRQTLVTILIVQTGMPLLAFGIAQGLGLSPALTAGFVVLGAVTPELVTPTMTELSGGDTVLATVVLLVVGFGTLMLVPGVVTLFLGGSVAVDPTIIITQLTLAVVLPMSLAVAARSQWPDRIGAHDEIYSSIAGLMVILIIGIVTAANASLVRDSGTVLLLVIVGALVLNSGGYVAGWLVSRKFTRGERIAATLSVGMRDFAVAAALLVGAGFPTSATLPAVVFGIVEMTTSAGLAKWFRRQS
ncbi:bile acid:sodium symporter family protein [Haladaptatus halobius]|uniref:bile acid:sodium symporter family protein n=1 Tax=Haladaptatus halobius TaxID=2884875 RepID=UPI001D09C618|nr:bile acid:sodium symporter [Haladaptatus halobius]